MSESPNHDASALAPLGLHPPVLRFGLVLAGLLVCLSAAAQWLYGPSAMWSLASSLGLFAVIAAITLRAMRASYTQHALGWCNIVTATRSAIVALLAGAVFQPDLVQTHGWLLTGLALLAFAMDGLDGWLARRSRLSSAFGARFDMEIDALLGAVLALIVLSSGKSGPEILALGFMRYAFVLAALFLPWLSAPLPDSFRRKTICVVQIAALIALLSPLLGGVLASLVSGGAVAALAWSFLLDVRTLSRARR